MSYQVLQRVTGRRETRRINLPVVPWEGAIMASGLTGGGGRNGMILDANGAVFCCGLSASGSVFRPIFSNIPLNLKVSTVTASCYDFWLTTKGGEVWKSTPWNHCGIKEFEKVDFPAFAARIFTDGYRSFHFSILTHSGDLYVMGANSEGELGVGDYEDRSSFVIVSGIEPIATVVSGYVHTVAIARSGNVYVTGSNINLADGVIGLPPSWELGNTSNFIEIPILKNGIKQKIVTGATDHYLTYLVSDSGDVYVAGGGRYPQFTMIDALCGLSKIAASTAMGIIGIKKNGGLLYAVQDIYGEDVFPSSLMLHCERQVPFVGLSDPAYSGVMLTDIEGRVYDLLWIPADEIQEAENYGVEIIGIAWEGSAMGILPIKCLPIGEDSCIEIGIH